MNNGIQIRRLEDIRREFAACQDDARSAAFYKKWLLVKHLTNDALVRRILVAWAEKHPGCSTPSKLHRCTKLELVRHLAYIIG
jgi:hypothetical protein